MSLFTLPSCDVVHQVLLEHVAPPLDDVQKSLFERSSIHRKPTVKHSHTLHTHTYQ